MVSMLPILLLISAQIPVQIPGLGGVCRLGLLSSRTPKSGPQSWAPPGAQRPHSPAELPLSRSWGTLPRDLATPPFARAKRGLLFPADPRGSRPNPANYRPHGGWARTRPPLSHGREESPSVRRGEQSGDSAAPARPPRKPLGRPFPRRLLLSCPLSLSACRSPRLPPRLFLSPSDSFSLCLVCLSLSSVSFPLCLSTPRLAFSVSLFPASLPWSGFNLPAHLWVHLGAQRASGPSFSLSWGPQGPSFF